MDYQWKEQKQGDHLRGWHTTATRDESTLIWDGDREGQVCLIQRPFKEKQKKNLLMD